MTENLVYLWEHTKGENEWFLDKNEEFIGYIVYAKKKKEYLWHPDEGRLSGLTTQDLRIVLEKLEMLEGKE